ncbi:hypothetical protein [Sclerotinia sclerotiorum fusarivirus 1]|uniref:Uncharacterized protein n=1 Tax=Sclerotinia sclerotiorum fusarivirus 1 TaxID=1661062 RepID=A0A0G3BAG2_9VIRU|nr:hypothetical protein [Sclerotinia sclerotiorum fusarivirus 1]AKJ26312.1 hypothetical protein [Sclerotinia sclerotiorum fusarivirus 1]
MCGKRLRSQLSVGVSASHPKTGFTSITIAMEMRPSNVNVNSVGQSRQLNPSPLVGSPFDNANQKVGIPLVKTRH